MVLGSVSPRREGGAPSSSFPLQLACILLLVGLHVQEQSSGCCWRRGRGGLGLIPPTKAAAWTPRTLLSARPPGSDVLLLRLCAVEERASARPPEAPPAPPRPVQVAGAALFLSFPFLSPRLAASLGQLSRAPPSRMDFDGRLLQQAGGFGRRVRLLAAASGLPNLPLALALAAGLLLAAIPQHRCRPDPALLPPALRNASGPQLLNASRPPGREGACLLYRYLLPGGRAPLGPNGTGPCTRGWEYALPEAGLRSTVVTQVSLSGGGGSVVVCGFVSRRSLQV